MHPVRNNLRYGLWAAMTIAGSLMTGVESHAQYYIATDSSISTGVKVLLSTERDNCMLIRVKLKNGGIQTFTPEQLTGYGDKGRVDYVSKTISVQGFVRRVFLNRRAQGQLTLYSYNSRAVNCFFLETKDGRLIPLFSNDSADFKGRLGEAMAACEAMNRKIPLVRFQKSSMKRLVTDFNTCSTRPFTYPKWGVVAGYGSAQLSQSSDYFGAVNVPGWTTGYSAFLVGLAGDYPISSTYFSIHADLLFSGNRINSTSQYLNVTTDVVYNSLTADFPLQLRYRLPFKTWRPFLNAGGLGSLNLETTGSIYTATNDQNNVITTGGKEGKILAGFMWGFVAGGGVEIDLRTRNTISFEVRSNTLFGEQDSLMKNQVVLLTGFTF